MYQLSGGAFTGQQIGLPAVATDAEKRHTLPSVPAGCAAILGRFDHLSERVDITAGRVVDFQPPPPPPSPDHQWDVTVRRWTIRADVAEREQRGNDALTRIAALEAAQHRAVREILLKIAPKEAKRLVDLDAQIGSVRASAQSGANRNL